MRLVLRVSVGLLASSALVACANLSGLTGACADHCADAHGSIDASHGDAPHETSHHDASHETSDGNVAETLYNDMTVSSHWTSFDVTTVNAGAKGFNGGTFDGRYVYFVPSTNGVTNTPAVYDGIVARYDTHGSFGAATSWTTFDTTMVDANAVGFAGASFDGRYLYLVGESRTAQYDTHAPFTSASSWVTFDPSTVVASDASTFYFDGATFDGEHVYFVPGSGPAVRYDSHQSFALPSSWSTFDLSAVTGAASGYHGGLFDGRYVYFIPDTGNTHGLVVQYDTTLKFSSTTAWATFSTTSVNLSAHGFHGGAFDGRYIYLVPLSNGSKDGVVARFDTHASFTAASSWSTFDLTTVNTGAAGLNGAGFDGRYVYFTPFVNNAQGWNGIVARLDSQAEFVDPSSWSTFDTSTVNAMAEGSDGAIFDGRYLYIIPFAYSGEGTTSGVVARFDTKTPPSMPALPAFHGSFF
jgi:hypothetical protein